MKEAPDVLAEVIRSKYRLGVLLNIARRGRLHMEGVRNVAKIIEPKRTDRVREALKDLEFKGIIERSPEGFYFLTPYGRVLAFPFIILGRMWLLLTISALYMILRLVGLIDMILGAYSWILITIADILIIIYLLGLAAFAYMVLSRLMIERIAEREIPSWQKTLLTLIPLSNLLLHVFRRKAD